MDKISRTQELCNRLLTQAEIIADAKTSAKRRSYALVRLSQTMFELARPTFHGPKLSEALRGSCVVEPTVGSSAVYDAHTKQLSVFGAFDLARLSNLYFVGAPKTIEGKKS